jgi:hypothetical protein
MLEARVYCKVFSMRIELAFERSTAYVSVFSSGRNTVYSVNAYSAELMKHIYLMDKKNLHWKLRCLAHSFPMRTEFLNSVLPASQIFKVKETFTKFKIGLLC